MAVNRREFVRASFAAAALLAGAETLGEFLASCGGGANPVANSPAVANLPVLHGALSNGVVTIAIDSSSPLASAGGAALVQYTGGALLAAHIAQNAFTALSSICTHQGCTVSEYDAGDQRFVCPCHGSQYDTNGQVEQGPAPLPLTQYRTSFAGDLLTIRLA